MSVHLYHTQPYDWASLVDHLRALATHAPAIRPDVVLANTHRVSDVLLARYESENAEQVLLGVDASGRLPRMGDREVALPEWGGHVARLLARDVVDETDVVRHDPHKLARVVLDIAATARARIASSRTP